MASSRKCPTTPSTLSFVPRWKVLYCWIDSLVAVDIRTWFTKELGVEVQVLSLLGGASIATLIANAASKLDRAMIPLVDEKAGADVPEAATPPDESSTSSGNGSTPPDSNSSTPTSMESSVILDPLDDLEPLPKQALEFEKTVSMPYGSTQFWYLERYLEDSHTSNIEFRLELNNTIDVPRLENAFRVLGQRHEALRAAFFMTSDCSAEPLMGILSTPQLEIVTRGIQDLAEADAESAALLSRSWEIGRGRVAKVVLLSLCPTQHYLIFGFHHIAIDGFSFNIILNEMNALYEGKLLPPVDHTFTDWATEQQSLVESGSLSQELEYWRAELAGITGPLPLLPMAKVGSRQTLTNYEFEGTEEITLSPRTTSLVKDLCKRHKVSAFNFFLAIFKIFLFRYLDVDRVCIGMADAGRGDSRTHRTVGYLLNLLPMVFENSPKQKFAEALQEARTKTFAALMNSKLPFTVLLEDLKVPRSSTHNPVFQAFIDFRQMNAEAGTLGAKTSGQHTPGRNANDIILDISTVYSEEIRVSFKAQKSLYSREAADIMLNSYLQLIDNFALTSDYQLSKTSLPRVGLFNQEDIHKAHELAKGQ